VQDALTVCERLLRERSRATTRAAAADAVSG